MASYNVHIPKKKAVKKITQQRDSETESTSESDNDQEEDCDNLNKSGCGRDASQMFSNNKSDLIFPKYEKENLRLKISSKESRKYSNEVKKLQQHVINYANELLFHWKNFSYVYPPSLTGLCEHVNLDTIDKEINNEDLLIKNLFIMPNFNELEEVSFTDSSESTNRYPKKLDKEQLMSIKKEGKFHVKSINFPGQTHEWVLARWLQLGYAKSNEYFFHNVSNSLKLLIVTAKRRFFSKTFSLLSAFKSIRCGFVRLLDLLIGLPTMQLEWYAEDLDDENKKFLVAELKIDPVENDKYKIFCQQMEKILESKAQPSVQNKFQFPYFFRTPDNLLIDLRLFDNDLMNHIQKLLNEIVEENEDYRKWFSEIENRIIAESKTECLNHFEITEKARKVVDKEFHERIFAKILENNELDKLSKDIGILLVNQAKSILIMREAHYKFSKYKEKHLLEYENNLKVSHPIKSKIKEWLNKCVESESLNFDIINKYKANEWALDELMQNDLKQAAYFLKREVLFKKQYEEDLIKKFKNQKVPRRVFEIKRTIWSPKNYVVLKHEAGMKSTVVEPKILEDKFDDAPLLSPKSGKPDGDDQTYFTLQKDEVYKNSSKNIFWRWKNFSMRTFINMSNVFFLFGVTIPFYSSVSLNALVRCDPFYPSKEINPKTGIIYKSRSSRVDTFSSKLLKIWQQVKEARLKFEQQPDRGLIGKSIQRVFNVIWNYIFKGLIATLAFSSLMPIICLTCSIGSLLLAFLIPIWFPILNFLWHIIRIVFYDLDATYPRSMTLSMVRLIIGKIIIFGLLEAALAIIVAIGFCPVLSLLNFLYCCITKFLRSLWDNLMFHLILKNIARIPSSDSFVARRVAGPGLASNHFYQISVEQGLAALEARLEIDILQSYLSSVVSIISEPLEKYSVFFQTFIEPFGTNLNLNNSTYKLLAKEKQTYLENYTKVISKRQEILTRSISTESLSNIRLKKEDLNTFLATSYEIIKEQHLKFILPYQLKNETEFLRESGSDVKDWNVFTRKYLETMFGFGFLTPLEDTDTVFKLDINHLNLEKYSEMIISSNLRDDLDEVTIQYNPNSESLQIESPYLEFNLFDPINKESIYERTTMTVPTRILHPAFISLKNFLEDKNEAVAETKAKDVIQKYLEDDSKAN